jgi:GNAT superfamily N-acetyltransferase
MIRALSAEELDVQIPALADVLLDVVAGGASVSFMAGLTRAEAEAYWQRIAAEVRDGKRVLFAAGSVDGTAQLILDTPPNQPHRAELAKMLVHRRARRRGLGRALFAAVEDEARRRGRTLLTFDTMTGREGEKLYLSCGCVKAGEIPEYALFPEGGAPAATSVFYKRL